MLIDKNGKPILPKAAKCFPGVMHLGDATVQLNADGSCSGDLIQALEEIENLPPDPQMPMLWLIANAISAQIDRDERVAIAGYDEAADARHDLDDTDN